MLRCTGGLSFQTPLCRSALVKKEEPEVERRVFLYQSKVGCCFTYGCFWVVGIGCSGFSARLA